jgi:hypothetical protein
MEDLCTSTILPIPKGKSLNYSDSINYRGIASSSTLGKIFHAYTFLIAACLVKFAVRLQSWTLDIYVHNDT